MKIKIIITDDHPMVRAGLVSMLQIYADIEILAQYESARQLLQGLQQVNPDVLLLDLQLSDGNGEMLIPVIKEKYPAVKILILTSNDNIHNIKLLLNKGADGYI